MCVMTLKTPLKMVKGKYFPLISTDVNVQRKIWEWQRMQNNKSIVQGPTRD